MIELKPCPLCGSNKDNGLHIITLIGIDEYDDNKRYSICCEECGTKMEIEDFKTVTKAIKAWNKKAEEYNSAEY